MIEIVLPRPKYAISHTSIRLLRHSQCLWSLNYREDVTVRDKGEINNPDRLHDHGIANNNGKYSGYFRVNGNLFMILDTDRPHQNLRKWTEYYSRYIKALFLINYYRDLKETFDELDLPVFPCFASSNLGCPIVEEETKKHSLINKDIPIFFIGKFKHNRTQRSVLSQMVKKHFPDSYIKDTYTGFTDKETYLNLLHRSKIVWSPPSVPNLPSATPHFALYARDREAMWVEALSVRPPVDIFTPEEIIPREHFVATERDNSNLIEIFEKYLSDDEERLRIAHNGRLYFERNCTAIARANYILEKCLSVID